MIKNQSSPQTCLLLPSLAQSRTWWGTMGLAVSGTIPHPTPPSPQGGFCSPRIAAWPWPWLADMSTARRQTQI